MLFAAVWIGLDIIKQNELSQTEKDKYDIAYMWNLKKKNVINKLIYRTGIVSQM